MFWMMVVAAVLIVTALLASVVTAVRDEYQASLMPRRKLKEAGNPQGNRALLVVLFPITLYILIGTLLLLLLTVIEVITKALRDYARDDEENPVAVIAWHEVSVFMTLLFPVVWPIAAVMVGIVFVGAVGAAILKTIYRLLTDVFRFLRRIWVAIIHALGDLLGRLVDRLRVVWETIVIGTQTIWEMIVGVMRQVLEQISASLRTLWATITDSLRL